MAPVGCEEARVGCEEARERGSRWGVGSVEPGPVRRNAAGVHRRRRSTGQCEEGTAPHLRFRRVHLERHGPGGRPARRPRAGRSAQHTSHDAGCACQADWGTGGGVSERGGVAGGVGRDGLDKLEAAVDAGEVDGHRGLAEVRQGVLVLP
eukprot:scaffold14012_cov88-Isochrysis_galbana.AAC.2